jgi:hypothetical protein
MTRPPRFYDSPWFKGTAAVVALLVGLVALIGPLRGLIGDIFAGSSLPRTETMIVFDHGEAMNEEINSQGATKLSQAKREAIGVVNPIVSDGLALRTFGGTCNEASSGPPRVPFGANHNDDVVNEIKQLPPGIGESNLYGAVSTAVQDFNDLPADTVKNVFVYVGGIDNCGESASSTATNIKNYLGQQDINAAFKFFTFDLSEQDQSELQSFKRILPEVEVVPTGGPSGAEGPVSAP